MRSAKAGVSPPVATYRTATLGQPLAIVQSKDVANTPVSLIQLCVSHDRTAM